LTVHSTEEPTLWTKGKLGRARSQANQTARTRGGTYGRDPGLLLFFGRSSGLAYPVRGTRVCGTGNGRGRGREPAVSPLSELRNRICQCSYVHDPVKETSTPRSPIGINEQVITSIVTVDVQRHFLALNCTHPPRSHAADGYRASPWFWDVLEMLGLGGR
jgi:hypothetical protein